MPKIKGKLVISVLIFLSLILVSGAIFIIRSPIVFVSDDWFVSLYGPNRNTKARIMSSIQLFRPIREIRFSELMDTQAMSETIQAFSRRKPYLVVFPERYRQVAALWEESEIAIPFLILDTSIYNDIRLDLYRAGSLSALLAQNTEPVGLLALPNTDPLLLDAFKAGYVAFGGDVDALYLPAATSSIEYTCITVFHSDAAVVSRMKSNQFIIFSWADPAYFGSNIRFIFDNSPWQFLVPAIRNLNSEGIKKMPSKIHFLHNADLSDSILRGVKEAISVQIP